MSESVNITCAPCSKDGEDRVSFNFTTVQLPKEKYLVWQIISKLEEQDDISFTVMRQGPHGESSVIYEEMRNGDKTPYEGLRNLYIANPKNTKGHFIVRVEACS